MDNIASLEMSRKEEEKEEEEEGAGQRTSEVGRERDGWTAGGKICSLCMIWEEQNQAEG